MKRNKPIFALAVLLLVVSPAAAADIDAAKYLENVKFLASDQMKGRANGGRELDEAAQYIASQFRSFGLRPLSGESFLLSLPITVEASIGADNRLTYWEGDKPTSLALNEEFRPLSLSGSGTVSGEVVFAGYGISAREYGYDDYAGIDVKGKLVMVLRHEPQELDQNSIFSGKLYTNHAQLESKALNARRRGAVAVLFVNDRPAHPNETLGLTDFAGGAGPPSPGIPFVEVRADVADRWMQLAGHSLAKVVEAVDRKLRPQSFALPASFRVELTADVRQQSRTVNNVAAYLPGKTDEYLVLGAHYDHVGQGEQFSMAPSRRGTTHNGADDNASGTSGLVELARWFSSQPQPRRGILFLTFAAEEIGLVGSNHYVSNPRLPLEKAIAMINMDMIGRLRNNTVYVGGVNTGSSFKKVLREANRGPRFQLETSDNGGYGSSDQFTFLPNEIPIMLFFTGLHPEYHTPDDTWDKIDAPAAARLVGYIGSVAERLLEAPSRPRFVKPKR
ncbi:MAG: M28 family peptidase [Bryobacteraceae bacterium]